MALPLLVGCSKSDEEKMQEKKAEATAFFSEQLRSNARFSNIFVQATVRCHGIATPTIEVDAVDIAAVDIVTSDGSLRCGDDYENVSELILYVHTSWHGMFEPQRDTYFRFSIPCANGDPRQPSLYFLQSTGATDEEAVRSFIQGYQIGSAIGELLAS